MRISEIHLHSLNNFLHELFGFWNRFSEFKAWFLNNSLNEVFKFYARTRVLIFVHNFELDVHLFVLLLTTSAELQNTISELFVQIKNLGLFK